MSLFLLFLVLPCIHSAKLQEDTFSHIKNTPGEQLVVFYRSSDPDSAQLLKTVEGVAKKIGKAKDKNLANFGFKKCDGDLSVNKADFDEAQFVAGSTFIFTSTPVEGIEKYSGPRTVDAIAEHIMHKYLPYDEADVLKFKKDEDWFWSRLDAQPEGHTRPVFVKFYEEWCEHCKRMRLNFVRAAGYFKSGIPGSPELPGVDFMEVHCSRDDDTTSFCVRNNVRSYPVLMLFTGEKKIQYSEDKTIVGYAEFFKKHMSSVSSMSPPPSLNKNKSDDEEEPTPPKPTHVKPAKIEKPLPTRRVESAPIDPVQKTSVPSSADDDVPAKPMGRFTPPTEQTDHVTSTAEPFESRLSALENSVDEIKQLLRAVLART